MLIWDGFLPDEVSLAIGRRLRASFDNGVDSDVSILRFVESLSERRLVQDHACLRG